LNKIVVPIILAVTLSLLFAPSLANADIKVTPPSNWQPAPTNNSTQMLWLQNSTKSAFGILKTPPLPLRLPLAFVTPFLGQFLADKGVLESADQLSFGRSNYGYRYLVNLNVSSGAEILNSSAIQGGELLSNLPEGYDVPFKGMLILTEKQGDLYAIALFSPKETFDSKLNEIQPTLDSIQLSNSSAMS
jgi:hypothetical protein